MGKALGIAGLVVNILAVACSGVAQYLPYWVKIDTSNHGVWRYDDGTTETDWLDRYTSDTDKRNAQFVRYTILGGGVFLVFSIILICIFICGSGKRVPAVLAAIFCLIAVGAHSASVTLFHLKFEPTDSSYYSYSFYLAIAAGALALIAGILKIAAAASAGTKVDSFGQTSRKSGRDKPQKAASTRSYNSRPSGGRNAVGSVSNRSYHTTGGQSHSSRRY